MEVMQSIVKPLVSFTGLIKICVSERVVAGKASHNTLTHTNFD